MAGPEIRLIFHENPRHSSIKLFGRRFARYFSSRPVHPLQLTRIAPSPLVLAESAAGGGQTIFIASSRHLKPACGVNNASSSNKDRIAVGIDSTSIESLPRRRSAGSTGRDAVVERAAKLFLIVTHEAALLRVSSRFPKFQLCWRAAFQSSQPLSRALIGRTCIRRLIRLHGNRLYLILHSCSALDARASSAAIACAVSSVGYLRSSRTLLFVPPVVLVAGGWHYLLVPSRILSPRLAFNSRFHGLNILSPGSSGILRTLSPRTDRKSVV